MTVCLRSVWLVSVLAFAACHTSRCAGVPAARLPPSTIYYVSLLGNDSWSGRLPEPNADRSDGPFASLERARDAIRSLRQSTKLPVGGITVELRGGLYLRHRTFQLNTRDSGTDRAPIIYEARPGEHVQIVGGQVVPTFHPVTDPTVLDRLPLEAKGKVLQADLRALGILDYGSAGGGGIELFFRSTPMPLARWPNAGFVKIANVSVAKPMQAFSAGSQESVSLVYEGGRPTGWSHEQDVWLHGYWFWDWYDQHEKVAKIDPATRTLTLAPPYSPYGYRPGQWFYAYNILSELDRPGEWYVDRGHGVLYFWPPSPITKGTAVVSTVPDLIELHGASYVTFRGITFEAARSTGIAIVHGTADRIEHSIIRNMGGWGVRVTEGADDTVSDCDISGTGAGGIYLSGGDRRTLTPGRHRAEYNDIHDYSRWTRTYQPAILLSGVANVAAHNLIHDAPDQAIIFEGNDHIIEYNVIHHVCEETNDAGAIYGGRDWSMRGTQIRFNYLHDIVGFQTHGCKGIYLDDMIGGTNITGNVFARVTNAVFIAGGRDNTIANNIFVDCAPSIHIDGRGLRQKSVSPFSLFEARLEEMPYKRSPWSTRYPRLITLLDDDPLAPKGNVVAKNIAWRGTWEEVDPRIRQLVADSNNLVGIDPRFRDGPHDDFRLQYDSPAHSIGFQEIPIMRIGRRQLDSVHGSRP